jgi:prolyl-tRNA synthetase
VGAHEKWGVRVVADRSLEAEVSWGVGANENDYHFIGAMPGRDFAVDEWADLVVAQAGDACPHCAGTLLGARGIEVSQVFQLGTKYSESMHAYFTAEDGSEKPFLMGCYGVGVSRSLAAVVEQYADEAGCAWPVSVAPLQAAVIPLASDDQVLSVADLLFSDLARRGIEVVLDDRDERAGVKFADADLIGWPYQVVVGKRGVAEGVVEIKHRRTGERETVAIDEAAARVAELVADGFVALRPRTLAGLPEA